MQKKQKIKPENQKLENYLEAPLRSPSRSSFVLNSRTAAAALLRCFLCFLFKGGLGVTLWSVQFSGSSVQLLLGIFSFSLMQKKQKLFTRYYCFFGIHESSISSLKICFLCFLFKGGVRSVQH